MRKIIILVLFFKLQTGVAQKTEQVELQEIVMNNTAADQPATYENANILINARAKVKYPSEARKKNLSGKVVVQLTINEQGYMTAAKVTSNTDKSLNEEALRLVKGLPRFQPATHNGKPVKVNLDFPLEFNFAEMKSNETDN